VLLRAPSAVGDVLDRITILEIKLARIDATRQANVARELDALRATWADAGLPAPAEIPEYPALSMVNLALWDVEDRLRAAEARGDFGDAFVADARAVYRTNDRRAALKRAINERFGSVLREEKAHPAY
jgi:hypothetical protein